MTLAPTALVLDHVASREDHKEHQDTCSRAEFAVEGMHCGTCLTTIEDALSGAPGVISARANLTARRVSVEMDPRLTSSIRIAEILKGVGYQAAEILDHRTSVDDARAADLMRRLGVAGFAAANIMLLSVSVWAGVASDMEASAQGLFHWLSALIALPSIAYSAEPFFKSAWSALSVRRLNMDVPISLGITLATAMSLYHTSTGSEQVYFDAAIMLTFFLLVGRYLDEAVRVKARGAAENLIGLKQLSAHVRASDGTVRTLSQRELKPGMHVLVAAGEHIPVDGRVLEGESEVEESLISGETLPKLKTAGADVFAGTVNLSGPITVDVRAADDRTLVAEIGRLMQAAEQGRGAYVRLADRAARKYAPAVHLLGLTTLVGWLVAGAGFEPALSYAIAVLIITCPCALALAVPVVQVAAATRLFSNGVILKSADGLERLAEIDTIVFDKTGTLTLGAPELVDANRVDREALAGAARLAALSRHPYSRAIVRAAHGAGLTIAPAQGVQEVPGQGLAFGAEKLGSFAFTGAPKDGADIWYVRPGHAPYGFKFSDELRPDARRVVERLKSEGLHVEMLSGDRASVAQAIAREAGIDTYRGEASPKDKLERLTALKAQGRRVLMIGDGLNDAPALAAGHASLSPASAADISQTAADAVMQGAALSPVLECLAVAKAARRMSLENFAIALAYNVVSVPLAMAGHVTPLIAALAMSLSSVAVVANALRLRSRALPLSDRGVKA